MTILVAGSLNPMLDEFPGAEPIDIGARRGLFVDDYLIDRFVGKAQLRLHRRTESELTSFAKSVLFHSSDERPKPDKALAEDTPAPGSVRSTRFRENVE